MAILPQNAAMLLKEHKHRPITGDVLLIGRQTVFLTENEALDSVREEGIEVRPNFLHEADHSTVFRRSDFITDRSFFSMFSDAKVTALDVSHYEDPEVVHDLNVLLPDKYVGIADFIFDGGCLDNLFDPAMAIKSMSRMLRPGGRIMHVAAGSALPGALVSYSPEWFFDFYALNDYRDFQTYICAFKQFPAQRWDVYRWRAFYDRAGKLETTLLEPVARDFVTVTIAEKGEASTDDRTPIQGQYREHQSDPTTSIYFQKDRQFTESSRSWTFDQPAIPLPDFKLLAMRLVLWTCAWFGIRPRRDPDSPVKNRLERPSERATYVGRLKLRR